MEKIIIRRKRKTPQLNMAPLIDMVFLLLIFFMLSTTFVQQTGIEINKPKAVSSKLLSRKNIIITVTKDSEIYLEKEKLDWKNFVEKLKQKINPNITVIIVSDLDQKLKLIVDIMDEVKKNGGEKLSIATSYEKWEE